MRNAAFLLIGVVFGVTLYKAEIISWYRIQEMFRFDSFHMYGVMGSAVATAMLSLAILSRRSAREDGAVTTRRPFQHGIWIGGLLFGMGWALTGACPGPLWVHIGAGTEVMLIAIGSALAGVLAYAFLDPKLPH
jgi:uncharacterized membrane protein YedE/YeeE